MILNDSSHPISMNSNFVDLVNEVQKLGLKSRETYKVYSELIPKSNYYFKWMKGKKTRDKLNESWVIDLLCKHYEASKKEVDTYIDLLLNSLMVLNLKKSFVFNEYLPETSIFFCLLVKPDLMTESVRNRLVIFLL